MHKLFRVFFVVYIYGKYNRFYSKKTLINFVVINVTLYAIVNWVSLNICLPRCIILQNTTDFTPFM